MDKLQVDRGHRYKLLFTLRLPVRSANSRGSIDHPSARTSHVDDLHAAKDKHVGIKKKQKKIAEQCARCSLAVVVWEKVKLRRIGGW